MGCESSDWDLQCALLAGHLTDFEITNDLNPPHSGNIINTAAVGDTIYLWVKVGNNAYPENSCTNFTATFWKNAVTQSTQLTWVSDWIDVGYPASDWGNTYRYFVCPLVVPIELLGTNSYLGATIDSDLGSPKTKSFTTTIDCGTNANIIDSFTSAGHTTTYGDNITLYCGIEAMSAGCDIYTIEWYDNTVTKNYQILARSGTIIQGNPEQLYNNWKVNIPPGNYLLFGTFNPYTNQHDNYPLTINPASGNCDCIIDYPNSTWHTGPYMWGDQNVNAAHLCFANLGTTAQSFKMALWQYPGWAGYEGFITDFRTTLNPGDTGCWAIRADLPNQPPAGAPTSYWPLGVMAWCNNLEPIPSFPPPTGGLYNPEQIFLSNINLIY